MIKKIKDIWRLIVEFVGMVFYSFTVSWKSSRLATVARMIIQLTTALLPFATIDFSSKLLDLLGESLSDPQEAFGKIAELISLIVFMAAIQVLSRILDKIKEFAAGVHNEMISNYLNVEITTKASKIDLCYFDSAKFNNDLANMKRDSASISTIVWTSIDGISRIVALIVSVIVLFKLNVLFTILILVTFVPTIINERLYVQRIYSWQKGKVNQERKMNYIVSVVTNKSFAKDIRLFNISDIFIERYKRIWKQWFGEKKAMLKKRTISSTILSVLPDLSIAVIDIYIGIKIIYGELNLGAYQLYGGMISQLSSNLFLVVGFIINIYGDKIRISNFRDFSKWKNSVENNTGKLDPRKNLEIQFDHVSFKYPGTEKYILKNINFSFNSKEKIAFVGVNGAGKTTLIKLILRFYDVTEGRILVNGRDIREYNLNLLRKCFSTMFQDYVNYAFTMRENITISDYMREQNEEEILEACRRSDADKLIKKWDKGLDTYIFREFEEDGQELSGGEGQKLALARTFYRDSPIVILDEPSASLDPESEYHIFQKFMDLCEGKGSILISHRLSNIMMVDKIFVIENGTIIEQGSHFELMELDGRYAQLFNYQAEKYLATVSNN